MKLVHSLAGSNVAQSAGALACALLFATQAQAQAALCTAQSPSHRVALLELYTSEGCDSCPPADAWLAQVGEQFKPQQAVSLALHVDYWDYIGWKDRFASPVFGTRHRALVQFAGKKTVYTPQVFANGGELFDWRNAAQVQAHVAQLNAQPASITLQLSQTAPHRVQLNWSKYAAAGSAQVYLAVVEDALVSHVTRGENKGATLRHAAVARAWHGPFAVQHTSGSAVQTINLPADAVQSRLRIVAFAQDAQSAQVLQAVSLKACATM